MIDISHTDWEGELAREFVEMIDCNAMELFMNHLITRRDGLIARSAWNRFQGQNHEADEDMAAAKRFDACHGVLLEFIQRKLLPGGVRIITSS